MKKHFLLLLIGVCITAVLPAQGARDGDFTVKAYRGNQTNQHTVYSMFIGNEQNLLHEVGYQYFIADKFMGGVNIGFRPAVWDGNFASVNYDMMLFTRKWEKNKARTISNGMFSVAPMYMVSVDQATHDRYFGPHVQLGWKSYMRGDTFTVAIEQGAYRFTKIWAAEIAAGLSFANTKYIKLETIKRGRLRSYQMGSVFRIVADLVVYPKVAMAYNAKSPGAPDLTDANDAFRARWGWRVFGELRYAGLHRQHFGFMLQAGVLQPAFYQDLDYKVMPLLSAGLFASFGGESAMK